MARKAAAPAPSRRDEVVEALMRLAGDRPWVDIEVTDIAAEAGITLVEMRELFPSKGAILGAFSRMTDRRVLEGTSEDLAGEPARERLFDVFMRRLDALAPYRKPLRRIVEALRTDPLALAALNRVALNSHRYMLASAGISTEGPLGAVKLQGAVLVFGRTLETWLDDDDPALARTMARLDREIRRGERFMERAEDLRRLTAPFRALGQSLLDRGRRRRRRERRRPLDDDLGDPAAAI
jgi:hypothetical protein